MFLVSIKVGFSVLLRRSIGKSWTKYFFKVQLFDGTKQRT